VGKGADRVVEVGSMRAELFESVHGGEVLELMERQGAGYRLSLYGQRDIDILRKLLDRIELREEFQPVLALGEGCKS
jgi:hypothetical protein